MILKYDQYYFEHKVHNYIEFLEIYKTNKDKAFKTFQGKIFCPLCCTAPLSIVQNGSDVYFRVSKNNMHLHADDCSNKLDEATRQEVREFFKEASNIDIQNRLQSCYNNYYRMHTQIINNNIEKTDLLNNDISFLAIKTKRGHRVRLPHKFLYRDINKDDIGVEKLFYGECYLYWYKRKESSYLKVLNDAFKEICSLYISAAVFKYLSKSIIDITIDKDKSKKFFICFVAKMSEQQKNGGKIYYNSILRHSDHILVKDLEMPIIK